MPAPLTQSPKAPQSSEAAAFNGILTFTGTPLDPNAAPRASHVRRFRREVPGPSISY